MLSDNDLKQFARQIVLPGFGVAAQEKLKTAKVLVIGCGGLGGPAALFLTAAGVGTIGIIDFDVVSLSNLHRQVLFTTEDIGQKKVIVTQQRLQKLYPASQIVAYAERLSADNALDIFMSFDVIVDGSDNFSTRYLVNDACEILQKPFVYAAIHQFEAQLATLNLAGSSTYRDMFETPPPPHLAPDCSTGGVLGALAGTVGSMQSLEAIKIITGVGKPLINTLLLMEFGDMFFKKIKIKKNPNRTAIIELIDYDVFCGTKTQTRDLAISKTDFLNLNPLEYSLFDIRTDQERDLFDIGGEHVDPSDIDEEFLKNNNVRTLIFYCASGMRSKSLVSNLLSQFPEANVLYLNASLEEFY